MAAVRRPAPLPTPGVLFRGLIESAVAEGLAAEDMTLRLTHGDVLKLKRDRDIPIADISFAKGEMRLLGVRVQEGGVAASSLDRGGA